MGIEWSFQNLEKVLKNLDRYKTVTLEQKIERLLYALGEKGFTVMVRNISNLPHMQYSNDELVNGVSYFVVTNGEHYVQIECTSEHVAFVEFGTGYIGKTTTGNKYVPRGAPYKVNGTGRGKRGWEYPLNTGEEQDSWVHTQGMSARPFVHTTADVMRTEIMNVAKEVWNG